MKHDGKKFEPKKRIETLGRRLDYLKERGSSNSYEMAEVSALSWALGILRNTFNREAGQFIVCAALRLDREILVGPDYMDETMLNSLGMLGDEPDEWQDAERGFIDNKGAFWTPIEAWGIAFQAGQIRRRVQGDDNGLLPANLY